MIISNRVNRIERAVDARLRALVTPDDKLESDYDFMQRVSEYVGGFPMLHKDKQMAIWRQSDARRARIMLATGCTEGEAALSLFIDDTSYCLNEAEARQWLTEFNQLRRATVRDMQAGLPGEQSEAGKQMVAMLMEAKQVGGEVGA
jgi:hypothetical protein